MLVAIGFLLVATGCAHFERHDLAPAETAAQLESRTLTNAALRTFLETNLQQQLPQWPVAAWDLDLLTLAAFYYSPSLEVARAQLNVARGGEITAAQRPNPTLNATPGYNTTTTVPSPWLPVFTLDVPIETAGKRRYRKAQAAAQVEAARFKVAAAAWQVRSILRSSLIDLANAGERRKLLQDQVAIQDQMLKLLEQQIAAGAIAASEPLPIRIALQKTRADLADTERSAAESRARVAAALTVPLEALPETQLSFAWLKRLDKAAGLATPKARRSALQSRSDVLSALAEYAAAQSALQLEIAKQYPDLKLAPGYEYDQGDNKWSLGLSLELPILHQNQGPIAEAKARRAEAGARFTETQAKVLAEIERAVAVRAASAGQVQSLEQLALEQSRRRDALAAQRQAGAIDQLEVLGAELDLASTRLTQLDGAYKLQQANAALEDAVQRPLDLPAAALEVSPAAASSPAATSASKSNK